MPQQSPCPLAGCIREAKHRGRHVDADHHFVRAPIEASAPAPRRRGPKGAGGLRKVLLTQEEIRLVVEAGRDDVDKAIAEFNKGAGGDAELQAVIDAVRKYDRRRAELVG